MPEHPSDATTDPMAREVDRLLARLTPNGLQHETAFETMRREPRPSEPVPPPRTLAPMMDEAPLIRINYDRVGFWARVVLIVALGALMTQWPYRHECGWGLLGYFGAITMVLLGAAWVAFASWRVRNGGAHVLALIVFFWGLVLAGDEILPRIGYSIAEMTWTCK
jgi:hypothetical protein